MAEAPRGGISLCLARHTVDECASSSKPIFGRSTFGYEIHALREARYWGDLVVAGVYEPQNRVSTLHAGKRNGKRRLNFDVDLVPAVRFARLTHGALQYERGMHVGLSVAHPSCPVLTAQLPPSVGRHSLNMHGVHYRGRTLCQTSFRPSPARSPGFLSIRPRCRGFPLKAHCDPPFGAGFNVRSPEGLSPGAASAGGKFLSQSPSQAFASGVPFPSNTYKVIPCSSTSIPSLV